MNLLCYLDPASISILATSLTAAFVAVAASAVIVWRKFTKKITKNSDPNKNKEAESDIHITDQSLLDETDVQASEQLPEQEQPNQTQEQPKEESDEKID